MNCIPFITVTLLMNRKDEKLKPNTFEYIYDKSLLFLPLGLTYISTLSATLIVVTLNACCVVSRVKVYGYRATEVSYGVCNGIANKNVGLQEACCPTTVHKILRERPKLKNDKVPTETGNKYYICRATHEVLTEYL